MNIGIIIQARMGSTRLPGKILKSFYEGRSLIEVILGSLHNVVDAKIVVATSVSDDNDELEEFLKRKGEIVYRGSENNVLDRFIKAAEENGVDGIVRICSDNPFLDWRGVSSLIEKAMTSDADYIGFRVNGRPSILTHLGFWGEFVRLTALKRVDSTTDVGTPAHEHVTYHIYNHPEEYKCEWIIAPDFLQGRNDIRLTIDTLEDFEVAIQVYTDLKAQKKDFTLQDVVEYLDAHVELKRLMMSNINQNKK